MQSNLKVGDVVYYKETQGYGWVKKYIDPTQLLVVEKVVWDDGRDWLKFKNHPCACLYSPCCFEKRLTNLTTKLQNQIIDAFQWRIDVEVNNLKECYETLGKFNLSYASFISPISQENLDLICNHSRFMGGGLAICNVAG